MSKLQTLKIAVAALALATATVACSEFSAQKAGSAGDNAAGAQPQLEEQMNVSSKLAAMSTFPGATDTCGAQGQFDLMIHKVSENSIQDSNASSYFRVTNPDVTMNGMMVAANAFEKTLKTTNNPICQLSVMVEASKTILKREQDLEVIANYVDVIYPIWTQAKNQYFEITGTAGSVGSYQGGNPNDSSGFVSPPTDGNSFQRPATNTGNGQNTVAPRTPGDHHPVSIQVPGGVGDYQINQSGPSHEEILEQGYLSH